MHIDDDIAYKIFNTWLTRCRKNNDLQSYLWVAERQKNGTIHFHMLTNTMMPIREVNGYMKAALITQYNKGNLTGNTAPLERYNGVDVDNLYKSKRRTKRAFKLSKKQARRKLQTYLTKYVSKNDIKSYRLPWHCSRDISALFTSQLYGIDEYNKLIEHIKTHPEKYRVYEKECIKIYVPLFPVSLSDYTDLKYINNKLFTIFHEKT